MKSSFAISENCILSGSPTATWPRSSPRRGPSAVRDDFERGGGRFARLVGLIAVSGAGDREPGAAQAYIRIAAVMCRIHAGEAAQVLDAHRLGGERLRPLIDDDLGAGEVAADVNRPVPLQLTALDDVDVRVVSVDGHRCRAGDLAW